MFTLGNIIVLAIWAICCIGGGILSLYLINDSWYSDDDAKVRKRAKIITLVMECVLIAGVIIGCGFYNTHTESGKRALKTWDSEKGGGLNRTVTVYDMQGEEVAKYQGKFDVEESQNGGVVKIKFDIDGKRHIIYAQTGTVLIDEE